MHYPKIETLFVRDKDTRKVIPGAFRLPVFKLIEKWSVTEKVDGTNVRIELKDNKVTYHGRTDRAQMPMTLVNWLQENLPEEWVTAAFDPYVTATIFGEGYGAGIQKGGNYRKDPSFRIFDVVIDDGDWRWWLDWDNVVDVADKLEVRTVPLLGSEIDTWGAIHMAEGVSFVAQQEHVLGADTEYEREGIVCRTDPVVLQRNGQRVVWKLKGKDFPIGL